MLFKKNKIEGGNETTGMPRNSLRVGADEATSPSFLLTKSP